MVWWGCCTCWCNRKLLYLPAFGGGVHGVWAAIFESFVVVPAMCVNRYLATRDRWGVVKIGAAAPGAPPRAMYLAAPSSNVANLVGLPLPSRRDGDVLLLAIIMTDPDPDK